jgi:hypothetical protein
MMQRKELLDFLCKEPERYEPVDNKSQKAFKSLVILYSGGSGEEVCISKTLILYHCVKHLIILCPKR